MKRLALFGSTGSIGRQTLDVVARLNNFDIAVLTAHRNWELLAAQAQRWKPGWVALADSEYYRALKDALCGLVDCRIIVGENAAAQAAEEAGYDLALNGIVGVSGLLPSYYCLLRGIDLALANKESLVLAGGLLIELAKNRNTRIIPVDSEHSAIFQCLMGEQIESVWRIILTASGGPFRKRSLKEVRNAAPEEALAHPTWKMGDKITIDSATLMNKGFEVIEAYWLFGLPPERVEVRLHPVSIVHSMVQFNDGSLKAQLGKPDMRLPIQFALTYPQRSPVEYVNDEPVEWPHLEFQTVDFEQFPCLSAAYQALRLGGSAMPTLNGADEAAVERYLKRQLKFGQIAEVIYSTLEQHHIKPINSIDDALEADRWAREFVLNYKKVD